MQRALVTGGGGFLGSNIALELEKNGWDVVVMDRDPLGLKENLPGFRGTKLLVDVAKEAPWNGKLDAIFHQAAITDPRYPEDDVLWKNNLDSYANVAALAKQTGANFIYASSAGVYGHQDTPMKEGEGETPITHYGESKLEMDRRVPRDLDGIFWVGLRYFNAYGPHESGKGRPASMIWHLANQIKRKEKPRLFEFGEQRRDFIYVKDIVRANLLALQAKPGIYNVGTGVATSFNELVVMLNAILGTAYSPEYFPNPYPADTYQHFTQADLTHAKAGLGYAPQWTLEAGIRDYFTGIGFAS